MFFSVVIIFLLEDCFLWCVEQLCSKKGDVGRTTDIDI